MTVTLEKMMTTIIINDKVTFEKQFMLVSITFLRLVNILPECRIELNSNCLKIRYIIYQNIYHGIHCNVQTSQDLDHHQIVDIYNLNSYYNQLHNQVNWVFYQHIHQHPLIILVIYLALSRQDCFFLYLESIGITIIEGCIRFSS